MHLFRLRDNSHFFFEYGKTDILKKIVELEGLVPKDRTLNRTKSKAVAKELRISVFQAKFKSEKNPTAVQTLIYDGSSCLCGFFLLFCPLEYSPQSKP